MPQVFTTYELFKDIVSAAAIAVKMILMAMEFFEKVQNCWQALVNKMAAK